jgi:excisionase family DNA binding protein
MSTLDQYDDLRGAYTLTGFCKAFGLGLTFVYEQIKGGKLRAVKAGKRTLILRRDADAWARSLPQMQAAS